MIPGNINTALISGAEGGYAIERSLRFNSSDSAYLSRTPASAGNRKTWTWAGWVKKSTLTRQFLFGVYTSGSDVAAVELDNSTGNLSWYDYSGGASYELITSQVFRDPSAWYHLVFVLDTTQATASNRAKIYVNGVQVSAFGTSTYPSQNFDGKINTSVQHSIGTEGSNLRLFLSGYLADIHFIDGQALDPSSFTEVSATTGQLLPRQYTGSFGTNGFWLKFSDNSAATATTLGKDYSGNNNNWTPNNFSVVEANYNPTITSTVGGIAPSIPVSRLFDGNTATLCGTNNAVGANIIFTKTISGVTSLRVFMDHSTAYRARINGGTWYSDSSLGASGNASWRSFTSVLPGNGIITSIESDTDGANNGVNWSAIEVNGVILVNSSSDSFVDTPVSSGTDTGVGGQVTGNYCTWNALDNGGVTLSNGNLDVANNAAHEAVRATFKFPSSGKWYCECTQASFTNAANVFALGVTWSTASVPPAWSESNVIYLGVNSANRIINVSGGDVSTVAATTANAVLQIAYDADSQKLWLGFNNSWYDSSYGLTGNPATGANATRTSVTDIFPIGNFYEATGSANFGQRPFAYTAPSGFKALCDTNLPAPVVAKPSTVMDVKLYTGNGSTQTISGLGFSPDLVWVKRRSAAASNVLGDVVRGITKSLYSNLTSQELDTETDGYISATTSDGFTVVPGASSANQVNASSSTYVAWAWDAGSSTVTNTQGSITSQVRANASAGFSIVGFAGTGTTGTVGHGLGVAPAFIIGKNRDSGSFAWRVYHSALGGTKTLYLNLTNAAATDNPI